MAEIYRVEKGSEEWKYKAKRELKMFWKERIL